MPLRTAASLGNKLNSEIQRTDRWLPEAGETGEGSQKVQIFSCKIGRQTERRGCGQGRIRMVVPVGGGESEKRECSADTCSTPGKSES